MSKKVAILRRKIKKQIKKEKKLRLLSRIYIEKKRCHESNRDLILHDLCNMSTTRDFVTDSAGTLKCYDDNGAC